MTLPEFTQAFHIIRPWVLTLVPVVIGLWWLARRSLLSPVLPNDGLAPHLRQALLLDADQRHRLTPLDSVALVLILLILAASGPAWSRVPQPFVAQSAPAVIVLKVSDSMTDIDVPPTRLERARQKIRDLTALRAGARTALVAYSGSAHLVVPMTEDAQLMQAYLAGLRPEIMPQSGDDAAAALDIASSLLEQENSPGAILFVLDGLNPNDLAVLQQAQSTHPLVYLVMQPAGQREAVLKQLPSRQVVQTAVDDSDLRQLDRMLNVAYRQALLSNSDQPWEDRGWLLAWPALVLILLWFRRGWTMQWVWIAALGLTLLPSRNVHAEGVTDWFFTPDQQAYIDYRNKEFSDAAATFLDPQWQAYTLYRDGQYKNAADAFRRLGTPWGRFGAGMASIRNHEYRRAIDDFEVLVKMDPDYPGAVENLALAKKILDYLEDTREQSDTRVDGDIGPDDFAFDNKDDRGAETRVDVPQKDGSGLLTAEQWMNTVDTDTGEFLRQRFAIEAARGPIQGLQ